MKKLTTILVFIFVFSGIFGQDKEKDKESNVNVKISGFVKNDAWLDTRRNAQVLNGLFSFYPLPENLDAAGNDLNAKMSINALGITSRLRTVITGPEVFGAKTMGYIEFDFSQGGASNTVDISPANDGVRFRQAFSKLSWEHTSVLFGRTWHPMFVTDVFPRVMSLNTGVPFQGFNRSEMLKVTQDLTSNLQFIGAAIYQFNYASTGPAGKSSIYIRNSMIPNMHGQLKYKTDNVILGAAADFKSLMPRTSFNTNNGDIYQTDERLNTYAFMGYFKFMAPKLTISGKAMYGQNLYEHLLPGGYAESDTTYVPGEGKYDYTSYNHLYSWLNIIYGSDLKVSALVGYCKNLGTQDDIVGKIYARGDNIDNIFRISPQITYQTGKMMFGLEAENTMASYGTIQKDEKGEITDTESYWNTRILFSVFYFF